MFVLQRVVLVVVLYCILAILKCLVSDLKHIFSAFLMLTEQSFAKILLEVVVRDAKDLSVVCRGPCCVGIGPVEKQEILSNYL